MFAWGAATRIDLTDDAIRPVALGREGRLRLGEGEERRKIAGLLSVVGICQRLRVDLRADLLEVLSRVAGIGMQKVAGLTPAA